jgi:nitrate reductase gamma subunit
MEAFLNIVAPIALLVFAIGVSLKVGRWLIVLSTRSKVKGVTREFEGGPRPIAILQSLKEVLINPITHFYSKSNKTWNRGYMFYHIAIITKVIGYSLAALILMIHVGKGNAIPDVGAHATGSYNYSPANLLAIIFGNGEYLQANFLFGDLAPLFVNITWVAVMFAVAGNLHMVYTVLRNRNAAITGDIDDAAKGVRTKGRFMWDRTVVRLLIFTIIWTELFARLHLVDGIVFVHAFLGLTLLTLFPFTYLFHMVYNFLALFYATRRRMARTIA